MVKMKYYVQVKLDMLVNGEYMRVERAEIVGGDHQKYKELEFWAELEEVALKVDDYKVKKGVGYMEDAEKEVVLQMQGYYKK